MYTKKILNRFMHPKFHKKLKKFNGVGRVGNVKCGDVMEIYIYVEKGVIKGISFLTYGCVAAIASSDVLCEIAKGKKLDDALKISSKDVVKKLGGVPPIKVHCSVLAQDALKKAVEDYRRKNR